jgi:hypothetical protein
VQGLRHSYIGWVHGAKKYELRKQLHRAATLLLLLQGLQLLLRLYSLSIVRQIRHVCFDTPLLYISVLSATEYMVGAYLLHRLMRVTAVEHNCKGWRLLLAAARRTGIRPDAHMNV